MKITQTRVVLAGLVGAGPGLATPRTAPQWRVRRLTHKTTQPTRVPSVCYGPRPAQTEQAQAEQRERRGACLAACP